MADKIANFNGANNDYENIGVSGNGQVQPFTVTAERKLSQVKLYGSRGSVGGGGNGTFRIGIYEGAPSLGNLIFNQTFNTNLLSAYGSPAWNTLNISNGPVLSPSKTYGLLVDPLTGSSNDELRWSTQINGAASPYGGKYYDWPLGTWTYYATRYGNFEIWGDVVASEETNEAFLLALLK